MDLRTIRERGRAAPAPPNSATPSQNHEYWEALSPTQRAWVLAEHPGWVGNRDGIPASVRHAANVSRFDYARARLEAERKRLKAELDDNLFGGVFSSKDAELWYIDRKLKDLDTLAQIVEDNPDGKLMLLDLTSGERGMAAFAIGDPDTADHIAVTAPGMNTNIDQSFNGMVAEAQSLRDEAGRQLDLTPGRTDETVATIAWLGYQPPQTMGPGDLDMVRGYLEVIRRDRATAAASKLADFYEGLDVASRNPDPHLTALGHSYGSYIQGLALQDPNPGQPVDDAVFYGSPGINADDESDLGLQEGHGYVMEADSDRFVADVGFTHIFGPDPSEADFEQLSTDEGTSPDGVLRSGVRSHGGYPHKGTMSEYNMAVVLAGLNRLVR